MTSTSAGDIRRLLDEAPMSGVQITAIALIALLSGLDGYDILSITIVGPAIAKAWTIGKAQLGLIFASSILGMALGSFLLAPIADVLGRRAVVLGALLIMIAGGILSAVSLSVPTMAASRVVTGLGIGTLVAVIVPLAAEFSNLRRRAMAISIMTIGAPLGSVAGGIGAALLLRSFGWPAVFYAKSALAAIMLPAILFCLPESPAFLLGLRRANSLVCLNAYLVRCGHAAVATLVAEPTPHLRGYRGLFSPGQVAQTLRISLAYGLFMMTPVYVVSWLPQLVADAGYKPATASLVSAAFNLSGVVGALLLGAAARWLNVRRLAISAAVAAGIAIAIFGFTPPALTLLTCSACLCGFFLVSSGSGLFATIAASFDAEARASGTGFAIGVGRVTSTFAPYFAGLMFANGLGRGAASLVFASCTLAAAIILSMPGRRPDRAPL